MFRVGDEVVCVASGYIPESVNTAPMLTKGATYKISNVGVSPKSGLPFLNLAGVKLAPGKIGFHPVRFRRVIRRDLTAWLSQTATYDEEQHAPAPTTPARKREGVS